MEFVLISFEQWLVAFAYVLAMAHYVKAFREGKDETRRRSWQIAAVAMALHLGYLIHLGLVIGRLPVTSVFETLTACAWFFGLAYLSLEWRLHETSLGLFILPIIIVLHTLSNLFLDLNRTLPPILMQEFVFEIHVVILLFSYSAFAISFIASLLYLLLSREIQKKSTGLFYHRLPSLAFFDVLSNRGVNIGLLFLTLGVLLGIYEGTKVAEEFFKWDAKFFAVGITWLIYFFHLLGRFKLGWQGRRAALLSLLGFGSVLFSFLIVSLAFSKVHHFR